MPDKSLGRLRVVVVSLGGVGSTALMDSLRGALGPLGVDISDVNDKDGLKHTPYGLLSRGALAAFDPTLVLYVLGNPAAAIASHYRRGFQGSQICLLSPSAESVLAETPVLNATHFPPASNVSLFPAYASLVAETGTDYFETYAHAASWLGATELGYTVVWATLRRLVQPETQAALGQLIFGASPRAPLYDFPVRDSEGCADGAFALISPCPSRSQLRNSTSWNPRGVPAPYLTLYASIYDRLLASFDGACASSSPTQCAAAGLRPIGNTTQLNASIMDAFGFRASAISIASARRTYIRLLPGVCGAHLRPKRRVRTVSAAATAQARAASLRGLQAAQPSHAAAAVANVSVVAPEREDRQVPGGPRADSKAPIGL